MPVAFGRFLLGQKGHQVPLRASVAQGGRTEGAGLMTSDHDDANGRLHAALMVIFIQHAMRDKHGGNGAELEVPHAVR